MTKSIYQMCDVLKSWFSPYLLFIALLQPIGSSAKSSEEITLIFNTKQKKEEGASVYI